MQQRNSTALHTRKEDQKTQSLSDNIMRTMKKQKEEGDDTLSGKLKIINIIYVVQMYRKKSDRHQNKQMERNIYPGDANKSPRQETLVTPQRMHPDMDEFRNIGDS